MRETFDMMAFVDAAYGVTILATLALVGLSWRGMKLAEARREKARAAGRKDGAAEQ